MKRLSLALALHNHQPVGNFGWVMEDIYRDGYLPMVECLERHPQIKVALHYTGFLLDWLRDHRPELISRIAALAARGQVELMGGGYFEPILPSIPDRDKDRQLTALRDAVEANFGQRPRGMWLAERVWEAGLARPLAQAGYSYTILDDSHFERIGLAEDTLYGPFLTEEQGWRLKLIATSSRLRYLIPWRPVEECIEAFREMAAEEPRLVLMGDDGEKFGGWPSTADLCWRDHWMDRFFEALEANTDWIDVVLPGEYLEGHPARGPVYLPAGSYPEMLKWSGGFWRNFISRYPEVNAMHKKMLRVSTKVEAAGAPEPALGRLLCGQANDAYWHGVFGGVYLPHLRRAVWENLIAAEAGCRPLPAPGRQRFEVDYDLDGHTEVLFESPAQTVYLAPAAGGAVVEWDAWGRNAADVMARRPETYHARLRGEDQGGEGVSRLEEPVRVREAGLEKLLNYDSRRRLVLQAYLVRSRPTMVKAVESRLVELGGFAAGHFELVGRSAVERSESVADGRGGTVSVHMRKAFRLDGQRPRIDLEIALRADRALDAHLVVEVNLALPGGVADGDVAGRPLDRAVDLGALPTVLLSQPVMSTFYRLETGGAGRVWYYPVETVNNSESGFERVVQGACLTFVQSVRIGTEAISQRFRLSAPGAGAGSPPRSGRAKRGSPRRATAG